VHAESIKNISGLAGAPQNYPYTTNPLVNHNKSISCGAPVSPGEKSDLGRSVRKIETYIHHSIDNLLDRVA
jgi:hypothetical protein